MDRQEIFDKVATHLLTQNQKAEAGDGECMYRAVDGNKCAVGCLIEDDEYNCGMEGVSVDGLIHSRDCPRVLKNLDRLTEHLVSSLQSVHDEQPIEMWASCLIGVGECYNLDVSCVTNWSRKDEYS